MSITEEELKKYRKTSYFADNYNIQAGSMRNYADKGYIRYIRTTGSHRKYHMDDINKLLYTDNSTLAREERLLKRNNEGVICYSRVDDISQSHILEHENVLFKTYAPYCQVIQEIGDEDDLERKELKAIIDRCYEGKVKRIIVTSANVLANDLFKLVKAVLDVNKVELHVMTDDGIVNKV